MGYVLVAIIGIALLALLVVALGRSRKNLPPGTIPSDRPVSVEQAAADAPTPAEAKTPSRQQVEKAERHTPPA